MSYTLLSNQTGHQHDVAQWEARTLEGELASFEGRTLLRYFAQYLDKSDQILEAGCGLGAWCEWFERKGYSAEGIEYDPTIVDKAVRAKPGIAVKLGDITGLEDPDGTYDAYVSLGVIEHFEHGPEKALEEAIRVLKPGGIGFFTTPLLTPLRRLFTHPVRSLYFFIQKLRGKPGNFWEYRFTKAELRAHLENAGFIVIDEDIDDYESTERSRHIGLWADWFFLRSGQGQTYELNGLGRAVLMLMKLLPASWYCSGYLFVVKTPEQTAAA